MRLRHVIARLSALSVVTTGALLSIATSPAPPPGVTGSASGPELALDEEGEEARFAILVEGTAALFARETALEELFVWAEATSELLPDPTAEDSGEEDAGAPLVEELTPEEAAEHPTAISLELTRPVELDAEGEEAPFTSAHRAVLSQRTYLQAALPLALTCDGDTCVARYEVTWRGPTGVEQTGPLDLMWSARATVHYEVTNEDGEEDYSVPEGAELLVEIVPLEHDQPAE